MKTEAISLTESKRLIQLEKIISEGEKTFVAVGNALLEIRDSKLYRADFSTFEDYCKEKWGWSARRGYQLIVASKTLNSLPETVRTYVHTETAARELSKIPPRSRPAVVEKIQKAGKPVTAATIAAKIPPPTKKTTPPPSKRVEKKVEPAAPPRTLDEIGRAIPDALLALWERRHETKELVTHLSGIRSKLKGIQDDDPLFAFITVQGALTAVENALQNIKLGMPHSLCPTCHGKNIEACTVCRHTGFISKLAWDATTAEETKQQILETIK